MMRASACWKTKPNYKRPLGNRGRKASGLVFSGRRRHTSWNCDWSSDVCSSDLRGAFVISLDFELLWGLRDVAGDGRYDRNLHGARSAIPRILTLFRQFEMAATWATVGFLFARDRDELADFFPLEQPRYKHTEFDPYREKIGRNESEDPLHFGRSLLEIIRETPRQEIGSHTFSHYYCLEEGQNAASFRADLESAQRIAAATLGVTLRSLVLPRNQFNPEYAAVVWEAGFICYRGNQ